MKPTLRPWLSILTILTLVFTPGISMDASAQSAQASPVVTQISRNVSLADAAIRTSDGRLRVIVQLFDAPLATYQGGIAGLNATHPALSGAVHLDAASPDSLAYIHYLKTKQADFSARLAQAIPGASVVASFQASFNGLSLAVPQTQLPSLTRMPGVAAVYPDQLRHADMDASLPLINAGAMWTALGGPGSAGKGIKIADVDTGLRPANPMFSGAGFTPLTGYPKGWCETNKSDPLFPCDNNKIIAARIFPDNALPVAAEEIAQGDRPLDIDGHGSHTAGTAAGDPVVVKAGATVPVDTSISGVAPAAYLMVYKALFEAPDHSGAVGTDTSLVEALNAAFLDGADVINNSWGSSLTTDPNLSVETPVINAITAAGTLVVFSAGNGGPAGSTITCPGCVENALTVAASITQRLFANPVSITGPDPVPTNLASLIGLQGTGPALAADINAGIKYLPSNAEGCAAFLPGTFTGAVALMARGTCNFSVKVNNALAAGALAVVVANNIPGPPLMMGSLQSTTIPSMMIDQASGQALIGWITANPASTIHLASAKARLVNPAWQDVMAGFSSVGPNGNPDVLKPDITAPGQLILSAYSPALINGAADPVYALLQGTSMAAPHVTGAAALVKQQHPDWSPVQIKTALTSTAVQTLLSPDTSGPAGIFNAGAGRLDLGRASLAGLTFDRSSFANANCVVTCKWSGTIKNVSPSSTETWSVVLNTSPGLYILVSPNTFTLAPGAVGSFTLTAVTSAVVVNSWAFGNVTWKDTSGTYSSATQPVAVMAGASANPDAISKQANLAKVPLGGVITYTLRVGNPYLTAGNFTLTDPIPANAAYILNSATGGMGNPTNNVLSVTGPLKALVAAVGPTGAPTIYQAHTPDPLKDQILSNVCPSPCQDTLAVVEPVDFYYMGQHYTRMAVSSNGYLIPGGTASLANNTPVNQVLPNKATPNNVIAPLWGRLIMKGKDAADPHTGLWVVWSDGTNTVYDWQNAQSRDNPADVYSFQVWIKNGTSQITFAYSALGSLTAHSFTAGMENDDGTHGMTSAAPPAAGQDLAVANFQDFATYTYQAQAVWSDLANIAIINLATATNDQNPADQPSAVAVTPLDLFRTFMPLAGKSK